jgi:hypothetical protein
MALLEASLEEDFGASGGGEKKINEDGQEGNENLRNRIINSIVFKHGVPPTHTS